MYKITEGPGAHFDIAPLEDPYLHRAGTQAAALTSAPGRSSVNLAKKRWSRVDPMSFDQIFR